MSEIWPDSGRIRVTLLFFSNISEILPQKCIRKEDFVFYYVSSITNALCDVIEVFSLSSSFECTWTPETGLSFGTELLYIGIAL